MPDSHLVNPALVYAIDLCDSMHLLWSYLEVGAVFHFSGRSDGLNPKPELARDRNHRLADALVDIPTRSIRTVEFRIRAGGLPAEITLVHGPDRRKKVIDEKGVSLG